MSDELVTRRLHISGLTPAITLDDLNRRLGSYGSVKSVDGLGKVDGLGQPRKYAYVTLEGKSTQIQKCINILSGAVWKGAKLRLGEAKPDYFERIARENNPSASDSQPQKKRRLARGTQGVHAPDMSLVTLSTASTRSGWKVLDSGRILRPVRMRPLHPLPPLDQPEAKKKVKGKNGKNRTRLKDAPIRARRRTIDMTRWGSTHLKGIYLDNVVADTMDLDSSAALDNRKHRPAAEVVDETSSDENEDMGSEEEAISMDGIQCPPASSLARSSTTASSPPPSPLAMKTDAPPQQDLPTSSADISIRDEAQQTLSFLSTLFGAGTKDWGGKEVLDEDTAARHRVPTLPMGPSDDATEVEIVPRVIPADVAMDEDDDESDASLENDSVATKEVVSVPDEAITAEHVPASKSLKDLFAPQEEEAGFSLMGHLDIDADFDEDLDFNLLAPPTDPAPQAITTATVPLPETAYIPVTTSSSSGWTFNPTDPLFFPRPIGARRGRAKDPLEVAQEQGRTWRALGFFKTETDEEIRAEWERSKVDLTREWKRRHREAVKSRRRRGGIDGD